MHVTGAAVTSNDANATYHHRTIHIGKVLVPSESQRFSIHALDISAFSTGAFVDLTYSIPHPQKKQPAVYTTPNLSGKLAAQHA